MKKNRILPIVMCAMLLTACGSNSKSDTAMYLNSDSAGYAYDAAPAEDYYEYAEEAENESAEEADYESAEASTNSALSNEPDTETSIGVEIQKEMLVYTCNMSIDVLEFDSAIDSIKQYVDTYGGFIDNESYNDGGSSSRWYDENAEKWQKYSATVRVPSKNYELFCNDAAELGSLRSKTASVDNLSREYYDLSTTLDIYEAKKERYIALLASISEDEYAVAVENELTDIQIEIAKIKSRMNDIRTDVAYSYVYLTVNEVKEYQAEPVKTDTFMQRLGNTLSESGRNFINFLENLLFFLIYTGPYIIIIAVIVILIIKGKKKAKAKKAEKLAAKKEASEPVVSAQPEHEDAKNYEEKTSDNEETK